MMWMLANSVIVGKKFIFIYLFISLYVCVVCARACMCITF